MLRYREFCIRPWQPSDRHQAAQVIATVLKEYGLGWEPEGADADVMAVETFYWQSQGAFWVVVDGAELVGTVGYHPIQRGPQAAEIRKMYLLPSVRGRGLGRYLLQLVEQAIQTAGYRQIWVETASVLKEAVCLYERAGYVPAEGVVTCRCDLIYVKHLS